MEKQKTRKVADILAILAGMNYKQATSILRETKKELKQCSLLDDEAMQNYKNSLG